MKVFKTNHLPAMWEVTIHRKKLTVKFSRGTLSIYEGSKLLCSKDLGVDESVLETSEMKIWFEYLYENLHYQ